MLLNDIKLKPNDPKFVKFMNFSCNVSDILGKMKKNMYYR